MHFQSQKKIPMGIEDSIFNRLTLLLGTETMDVVTRQRVIIFGVGGVGSWCAESLVRSGIRHLTLVDSDCVCIVAINFLAFGIACDTNHGLTGFHFLTILPYYGWVVKKGGFYHWYNIRRCCI